MGKTGTEREEGTSVLERRKVARPPLFKVFLLNDDYTTMEFVVHVLETIFHKSAVEATQIMLHVHRNGMGLAGVYPRDIAETKIEAVHAVSREHSFPLRCAMEKE